MLARVMALAAYAAPRAAPMDYVELTKPRIVAFVLGTVAAGYVLAPSPPRWPLLVHALVGTALVAGGASALNQVAERDVDARMRRTARRPLPAGRIGVVEATIFAWLLAVGGVAYLAALVNGATALLAAATVVSYAFVYTPLKRRTALSTLVGAIPGAIPIVGGWAAAAGPLDVRAGALFWLLFFWQLPHFLALSWLYREDYARAGLATLSADDTDGGSTFRQASLGAAVLLPVSLVPAALLMAGPLYFAGAMLLAAWFVAVALRAAVTRSPAAVRRLFTVSLVYLPAILTLMIADRMP